MANRKKHLIYFPGLGDHRDYGQSVALNFWKIYGINAECYRIGWSDSEPFSEKLEKVLDRVDVLSKSGSVAIMGASAGASAALNVFARRQDIISKVVCVAGKIGGLDKIGQKTFQENPAFKGSIDMLPGSLGELGADQRSKILSLHPIYDGTVPVVDTIIDGATERSQPVIGHPISIFYALTIGSYGVARFINQERSIQVY